MRWLRVIMRPFRRFVDQVLDIKHEMTESVGSGVSIAIAPLRWIWDGVATVMHFFGSIAKELNFLLPVEFVSRWSATRNYRLLPASIPALLAGVALVAGAIVATFSKKPTDAMYFVNRAIAAKQAGRDDVAELFLRKASFTVVGTRESRFNQALLLQSVGREADAYSLMQQLAPDGTTGFIPAHEWRVHWFGKRIQALSQKESGLTDDDIEMRKQCANAIEHHLQLILKSDPDHLAANDRLAVISMARNDATTAIKHISRIIDKRPGSRIVYAQLLAKTGQTGDARTQALLAQEFHSKALEKEGLSENEAWQQRLKLSAAYMLTENYRKSIDTLVIDGQMPKIPQVQQQLSDAMFNWSETIEGEDGTTLIRKLELLGQAIKLQPGNPKVLRRIAAIAGKPGEPGTIASQALKDILSSGQAPPVVHFVLAMNASQQGDTKTAIAHYELAFQAGPEVPVTLNNLAYIIAQQKKPDLNRALDLVTQAIELNPDIPDFFDTRGEILMKMGQWKLAIVELEKALKKIPGRPALHYKLAVCYDAVGDGELASLHRLRAQRHAKAAKEARDRAIAEQRKPKPPAE